jgi:hypothetical protein
MIMANREACELYIEQEIKAGLKEGKKPYSIGKEIAAWVEKVFEVNIKPNTLIRRAERMLEKEDITTNVVKESNTETNTATYKSEEKSVTHPPTDRGGKRKNAGRPKKPEEEIIADDFKLAFNAFYQEVQNAKLEKWEGTSKEMALYSVSLIYDLITIS